MERRTIHRSLARRLVYREVGLELARELFAIETREMAFGVHWWWETGAQYYTPAGLTLFAARLREMGCPNAAARLEEMITAAEKETAAPEIGGIVPVERREPTPEELERINSTRRAHKSDREAAPWWAGLD